MERHSCVGGIHMQRGHSHIGCAHMWEVLTCGGDIHMWEVAMYGETFMCRRYSHAAGTFTHGTCSHVGGGYWWKGVSHQSQILHPLILTVFGLSCGNDKNECLVFWCRRGLLACVYNGVSLTKNTTECLSGGKVALI